MKSASLWSQYWQKRCCLIKKTLQFYVKDSQVKIDAKLEFCWWTIELQTLTSTFFSLSKPNPLLLFSEIPFKRNNHRNFEIDKNIWKELLKSEKDYFTNKHINQKLIFFVASLSKFLPNWIFKFLFFTNDVQYNLLFLYKIKKAYLF